METQKKSRFYLILEGATVAVALFLYLAIFRPKEKIEAEWTQYIERGQLALDKGSFAEARSDFQSALKFSERHKRDSLDVAGVEDRLADADRGLEHYEEALLLDEHAQPVFENYQTRWEGRYAEFLAKFAGNYQQVGRYGEAEARYKEALLLQEKIYGSDASQLVPTLNAMVYFYYDRNRDEIAEPLAKRSAEICKARLGPKDACTAYALSMLSLVYDGEGKFTEAEQLTHEALPILESSAGPKSYEVASTLNRQGLALDGELRWPEAEVAFSKALAIRQELSGPQSNDLVAILHNLARLYDEEGEKQKAAASRERAQDIVESHQRDQMASPQISQAIPVDSKPGASSAGTPIEGVVGSGIYTNNFFHFSIQFPQSWKVLDRGSAMPQSGSGGGTAAGTVPPSESSIVEAGYVLFWAGTADKQTQEQHWIMLCAFKPGLSRRNVTSAKFLKTEADALKLGNTLFANKGDASPTVTAGPIETEIAGKRMMRLDENSEVNDRPTRIVQLASDERGYILWYVFADPNGNASYEAAAKQIDSLRFVGSAN